MSVLVDQHGHPLPSREEREAIVEAQRSDAWANPQTGVGLWGQDKTKAATYLPVWRVLDQELTSLMNGSDIARKIVSKRPEEMFRRGFEIEADGVNESERDTIREFATDQLSLEKNMREAKRWGRLYGGCLLLMGIDDGRYPWEPLDEANIREFYSLSLVDRRYAYVQSQYAQMGTSSQYGNANVYLISNAVAGYGWEEYGAQKIQPKSASSLLKQGAQVALVHESRVLRFDGNPADVVTRQNLAGWSWSVLQVVYDAMRQFEGAFDSAGYLLADASQAVYKLSGLIKAISSGNRAAIAMRMQLMEQSRSVIHGIALDAGDKDGKNAEDFTRQQTPFGGIPDLLDKMMLRMSSAADMPATELFGRAPAGLNATGESDTRKWYDTIESEQKNDLGPQIKRVFKLLSLAKKGPFKGRLVKGKPVKWKIKFHPLWTPDDKDAATARLTDAQRDQIYIEEGCVKPEEVSLNLAEIYPNMDVKAREEALKAAVMFDPYENEPSPQNPGAIGTGEPLSSGAPVPLLGTSGTQTSAGALPAVAAAAQSEAASHGAANSGLAGPPKPAEGGNNQVPPTQGGPLAAAKAGAKTPQGLKPTVGGAHGAETTPQQVGANAAAAGQPTGNDDRPPVPAAPQAPAVADKPVDKSAAAEPPGAQDKPAEGQEKPSTGEEDKAKDIFSQLLSRPKTKARKDAEDAAELHVRFDAIAALIIAAYEDEWSTWTEDDWDESKHPRGNEKNAGQFGSGGGGAAPKEPRVGGRIAGLGKGFKGAKAAKAEKAEKAAKKLQLPSHEGATAKGSAKPGKTETNGVSHGTEVAHKETHEASAVERLKAGAERAKAWLEKSPAEVKSFFTNKAARTEAFAHAAHALRAAPGAVGKAAVNWVKGQVHEVKTAFVGIKHAITGQKVSTEEKKAIHKVAIKVAAHVAAGALIGIFPPSILHGAIGEKIAEKAVDHVLDHVMKHIAGKVSGLALDALEQAGVDPEEWLGTKIATAVAEALENISDDDIQSILDEAAAEDEEGDKTYGGDEDEPEGADGAPEGEAGSKETETSEGAAEEPEEPPSPAALLYDDVPPADKAPEKGDEEPSTDDHADKSRAILGGDVVREEPAPEHVHAARAASEHAAHLSMEALKSPSKSNYKALGEAHLEAAAAHAKASDPERVTAHKEWAAQSAKMAGSEWDETKHPRGADGKFDAGDVAKTPEEMSAAARDASNAAATARTPAKGGNDADTSPTPLTFTGATPLGNYGLSLPHERTAGESHIAAAAVHSAAAAKAAAAGDVATAIHHEQHAAAHMNCATDHAKNAGSAWDHEAHPLNAHGKLDGGVLFAGEGRTVIEPQETGAATLAGAAYIASEKATADPTADNHRAAAQAHRTAAEAFRLGRGGPIARHHEEMAANHEANAEALLAKDAAETQPVADQPTSVASAPPTGNEYEGQGAIVIIWNAAGEVLCVSRPEDEALPDGRRELAIVGGHIEPGETPGKAGAREVHEELGIHVSEFRSHGTIVSPVDGTIVHVFTAGEVQGTMRAAEPTNIARWMTPMALLEQSVRFRSSVLEMLDRGLFRKPLYGFYSQPNQPKESAAIVPQESATNTKDLKHGATIGGAAPELLPSASMAMTPVEVAEEATAMATAASKRAAEGGDHHEASKLHALAANAHRVASLYREQMADGDGQALHDGKAIEHDGLATEHKTLGAKRAAADVEDAKRNGPPRRPESGQFDEEDATKATKAAHAATSGALDVASHFEASKAHGLAAALHRGLAGQHEEGGRKRAAAEHHASAQAHEKAAHEHVAHATKPTIGPGDPAGGEQPMPQLPGPLGAPTSDAAAPPAIVSVETEDGSKQHEPSAKAAEAATGLAKAATAKAETDASEHLHAAKAHGMAARAHRDAALEHTELGNKAATKRHLAAARDHDKAASGHAVIATTPTRPVPMAVLDAAVASAPEPVADAFPSAAPAGETPSEAAANKEPPTDKPAKPPKPGGAPPSGKGGGAPPGGGQGGGAASPPPALPMPTEPPDPTKVPSEGTPSETTIESKQASGAGDPPIVPEAVAKTEGRVSDSIDEPLTEAELAAKAENAAAWLVLDSNESMRPDGKQAKAVFQQLLDDYPVNKLGWILGMHWHGPVEIPLELIDDSNRDKWAASHDGKLESFKEKITEGTRKPAVLVKTPNNPKYIIVDGHHRFLGHEALGMPLLAYFAEVHVDNGPWDELHAAQKKGKSGPRSGSWTSPSWGLANAPASVRADVADALPQTPPEAHEHAVKFTAESQAADNSGGGYPGWKSAAEHHGAAAFHLEKTVQAGHQIYGAENVKAAHQRAAKSYSYAAKKAEVYEKDAVKGLRTHAAAHREAASSGEWDETKHPRDENGKFDALDPAELPNDFGTEVPVQGSSCSDCRFLIIDGEGAMPECRNETFVAWVALRLGREAEGGRVGIPAPDGDPKRYCCSAWQAAPGVLSSTSTTDAGDWEEGKHPRGEGGKFGSGSGGGKEKTEKGAGAAGKSAKAAPAKKAAEKKPEETHEAVKAASESHASEGHAIEPGNIARGGNVEGGRGAPRSEPGTPPAPRHLEAATAHQNWAAEAAATGDHKEAAEHLHTSAEHYMKAGMPDRAAKVRDLATAHERTHANNETAKGEEAAAPKDEASKPLFDPKTTENLPVSAVQSINDRDALFAQAKEAFEQQQDLLNRGKGLSADIGAATLNRDKMTHEEFGKAIEKLHETKGPIVVIGAMKKPEAAERKVNADYGGQYNRLGDIVRATVAVDSMDQVRDVVKHLEARGIKLAAQPKDRFAKPTEAGYRDLMMKVQYPNGHIGELQVHVKPMLAVKGEAHKFYEVARVLEPKLKDRSMTKADWKVYDQNTRQMRALYNNAWKKAGGTVKADGGDDGGGGNALDAPEQTAESMTTDWDPDQPRVPAGEHGGGQFGSGGGGAASGTKEHEGAASTPAHAAPASAHSGHIEGKRTWTDKVPEGMKAETWMSHYDKNPWEGGKVSAERDRDVHQPIIHAALDGVKPAAPGEQKIAIMTMGAPGSGKSSALRGVDTSKYVKVDPDDIKESIPEYRKAIEDHGNTYRGAAAMAQKESGDIRDKMLERAMERGNHLILDGTGADSDAFVARMQQLQKAGYHVHVTMPHLNEEEGIRRVQARAEVSGRMVPEKFARDAYKSIPRNFEKIARAADSFKMVSTDVPRGEAPHDVWSGEKGKPDVEHDPAFVKAFREQYKSDSNEPPPDGGGAGGGPSNREDGEWKPGGPGRSMTRARSAKPHVLSDATRSEMESGSISEPDSSDPPEYAIVRAHHDNGRIRLPASPEKARELASALTYMANEQDEVAEAKHASGEHMHEPADRAFARAARAGFTAAAAKVASHGEKLRSVPALPAPTPPVATDAGDFDESKHPRGPDGKFGEGGGGEKGGTAEKTGGAFTVRKASPKEFHKAFEEAFKGSPFSDHVTHYTEDQLHSMTLLTTEDGKTGVAIHDHGDGRIEATALFNQGGAKGAGLEMLRHAALHAGANYVECYGPKLNTLYAKLGFQTVTKDAFNPKYASPTWDAKRFDSPDYYTMRLPSAYETLHANFLDSADAPEGGGDSGAPKARSDYSEEQPRDEHGRFGSGGGAGTGAGPTKGRATPFGRAQKAAVAPSPSVSKQSVSERMEALPLTDPHPPGGEDPIFNGSASNEAFAKQAAERTAGTEPYQHSVAEFTSGGGSWYDIRDYERDPEGWTKAHPLRVEAWEKMRQFTPDAGTSRSAAEKYSQDIEKFFAKSTPSPGLVYRGMRADDAKLKSLLDKDTLVLSATSSSSRHAEVGMDFAGHDRRAERPTTPVILRLRQTSGVAIEHLSKQLAEREILLPKGTRFRVTGRSQTAGYLVVDAEEVSR